MMMRLSASVEADIGVVYPLAEIDLYVNGFRYCALGRSPKRRSRVFGQDFPLYFHVWILTCESLIPTMERIAITRATAEETVMMTTSIFVMQLD
jgi:hypothetical protein